jgi:hypothetical protein
LPPVSETDWLNASLALSGIAIHLSIVKCPTAILFGLVFLSGCDRKKPEVVAQSNTSPPPQPTMATSPCPWRNDGLLKERFLPDYPDDLQVIIHDGGPRITEAMPELIWARVDGMTKDGHFTAVVLNQPHGLKNVTAGGKIQFMMKPAWEHPVQVRDEYLKERPDWKIHACDKCGFDELFDPPSALLAKIFANVPADAKTEAFTSFCPLCRGVQVVAHKDANLED